MGHIRPEATVQSALRASDAGVPDAENARRHGVAVKTIRRWRRLYQRRGLPRGQTHLAARCPRCDGAALDEPAYAELLGWYLGDGHITEGRRGVHALHVFNDRRYPEINAHVLDLMRAVKPGSRPHTREVPGCVISTVSWKHWPCLFPQHGPGPQARAGPGPRGLAERDRHAAPRRPAARAVPLRRLPGEQLDPAPGGRRDEALRLPAVAVHQQLPRHPALVLRGARPGRRTVAGSRAGRPSRSPPAPGWPGSTSCSGSNAEGAHLGRR